MTAVGSSGGGRAVLEEYVDVDEDDEELDEPGEGESEGRRSGSWNSFFGTGGGVRFWR